jgi:hypothetical protein
MQEEGRVITAAEAVENMKAFATAGVVQKKTVEVFAVGSQINIIHANQSGTVVEVCISANDRVQAWWDGVTRCSEWLEAFEVEAAGESQRMVIGFRGERGWRSHRA